MLAKRLEDVDAGIARYLAALDRADREESGGCRRNKGNPLGRGGTT